MKKIIMFICVFMFLIMPTKTYADSATVEIKVKGEVKNGSNIEILVNVKDVEKLYAASVDFTYNTNQLKVESISAGEFISDYLEDIMELGGEVDKNGNTASYSFTFLGEKNGVKGKGTLAIIKAQVLNDEKLSIGQDSMKVKLVKRVKDTVENYSYKFKGYNILESDDTVNNNQGNSNNNENDNNENNSNENDLNNNEDPIVNDKNTHANNDIVDDSNNVENVTGENSDKENTEVDNNDSNTEKNENSSTDKSENEQYNNIKDNESEDKENTSEINTLGNKNSKNNNKYNMVIVAVCIITTIIGLLYYLKLKKDK